MMTNKEKALEQIEDLTHYDGMLHRTQANKLVELASKPDWHYPIKGDFPTESPVVGINIYDVPVIAHYSNNIKDKIYFKENIFKFTYLDNNKTNL